MDQHTETTHGMDVYDAVATRRAVRGFTADPLPKQVLQRVLTAAARSPSTGNLQPWNIYVVTGAPLADLKCRAMARAAARDPGDSREFEMYPANPGPLYHDRQIAAVRQRFTALGIAHEDTEARAESNAGNWRCYGAPAALFCFIRHDMGFPQWADLGMYLQTVMLLLRAEGLHSCPQMAWTIYRKTVADIVRPAEHLMLYCGMSIGFEDPSVKYARIDRAPLSETVTFLD